MTQGNCECSLVKKRLQHRKSDYQSINPISTGRFFTHFVLGGAFFAPPSFSPKRLEI